MTEERIRCPNCGMPTIPDIEGLSYGVMLCCSCYGLYLLPSAHAEVAQALIDYGLFEYVNLDVPKEIEIGWEGMSFKMTIEVKKC